MEIPDSTTTHPAQERELREAFSVWFHDQNQHISMDAARSADRLRVSSISHLSYHQTPYHRYHGQGSKVCDFQGGNPHGGRKNVTLLRDNCCADPSSREHLYVPDTDFTQNRGLFHQIVNDDPQRQASRGAVHAQISPRVFDF